MGELIRNIREIQLGNETLMVEENEGYSAHQGRLIHIQNRDFRYLMSEKSFIQLLTTILRAREEKNYYKANFPRVREEERLRHFEKKNERTDAVVGSLAAAFQGSGLRFRLVDRRGADRSLGMAAAGGGKRARGLRQVFRPQSRVHLPRLAAGVRQLAPGRL